MVWRNFVQRSALRSLIQKGHRPDLTVDIDAFRLRTGQHPDPFRTSSGNNALASDREGFNIWMRQIASENLAVQQDHISRRLLAGRQRCQKGKGQRTEQNPGLCWWHGNLLE
jgi:hypothetical protein